MKETCIAPAKAEVSFEYGAGFSQLMLRIDASALQNTLSALVGWPVGREIEFSASASLDSPRILYLRRMIDYLAGELDCGADNIPELALAEFEQLVLVSFLAANTHNFSHLLENRSARAGPWQIKAAEDYIEANWSRPIYVEEIAKATGASARSLFQAFKKARGCSPMEFVKSVRLKHARRLLLAGDESTTVTAVGYLCGFHNMGHFARNYLAAFGELPSETLASGKRGGFDGAS
jgi:AraC-like DNA-binding protein